MGENVSNFDCGCHKGRERSLKGERCCWCSQDASRSVVPHRWQCHHCFQCQSSPETLRASRRAAREAVLRFGDALERLGTS